jgi:hypothetical protein
VQNFLKDYPFASVLQKIVTTNKEHWRNIKRIAKVIKEINVQLGKEGIRLKDLQAQVQTNPKNVRSSKSKRKKLK